MADLPTVSQAEVELRAELAVAEQHAGQERERRKRAESNAEGAHLRARRAEADAEFWKGHALSAQARELALSQQAEAARQMIAMLTSERDSLRRAVDACNSCVSMATAHRWLREQQAAHLRLIEAEIERHPVDDPLAAIAWRCAKSVDSRPAIGGDHG